MSAGGGAPQRREGEISLATRRRLFLVSGVVLAALMVWALGGMPGFGDYHGIYGLLLNRVAVPEEHATNVITAVNFDYRGFDTLGEEFILFASVLGLALILRERRDEEEGPPDEGHRDQAHGAITPGGGFQGGVIAATALLLVYLGGEYVALRRLRPLPLVEITKATGAAAFVLIGVGGLIFGAAFLENFLPKGTPGDVFSAGTMQPLSVAVGLEITGGFVLILSEFLDQTLVLRRRRGSRSQ